jgi:glycosyltransferase involved in cell wall biosynthesis
MTVLHLCGPAEGGVAVQRGALLRDLPELAVTSQVIVAPITADRLALLGVDAELTRQWPEWRSPGSVTRCLLDWRIRATRVSVVHAQGHQAGVLAAAVLLSIPERGRPKLIISWHNALLGGGWRRRLAALAELFQVGRADLVTGASSDLVARAATLGARRSELAMVAAPAVPVDQVPVDQVPVDQVPVDHFDLNDGDTRIVLTISRIAPQKNLPILVEAAAQVRQDSAGHPVLWVVVGGGDTELAERLREQSEGLDAPVLWAGPQPSPWPWLARADVFVLASAWEARSLAVQEAMAVGLPIVATAVGGLVDLVGGDGRLVPAGDPKALADAVRTLLDNPDQAADCGAAARKTFTDLPTETDVASQWSLRYAAITC